MRGQNSILEVNNEEDIKKITENIKYINLNLNSIDNKVIDYFLNNGINYRYAETIGNKKGFIYVDYKTFTDGIVEINTILDEMPINLNILEKAKYLYIKLGLLVGYDINTVEEKNEIISLNNITPINNIWGALSKRKVTEESINKILVYLYSRVGIKSEIVKSGINGNLAVKIYLENTYLIVNLSKDLSNIKGRFRTEYFDKYNVDKELDKKINYIKEDYTDYYLDKALNNLDYTKEDILYEVLSITEKMIDISSINTYELSEIYQKINKKYFNNYNIKINNFYLNKKEEKEHFIVISYDEKYYSYNYIKKTFIRLDYNYIIESIKNKIIKLYQGEDFNISKGRKVVW